MRVRVRMGWCGSGCVGGGSLAGLEHSPVDQRTARADGTELEAHRPRLRLGLRLRCCLVLVLGSAAGTDCLNLLLVGLGFLGSHG